jgi:hypothetical protein
MIPLRVYLIGGAVVTAGVGAGLAIHYERQVGAANAAVAQAKAEKKAADSSAAYWRREGGKRDTIYLAAKTHLAAGRKHTDSTLADTSRKAVPVPEVRAMLATERASCDAAIAASESRCQAKDSTIKAQQAAIDALNHRVAAEVKLRPGFFQSTGGTILKVGGGLIVGYLIGHH